MKPSEAEDFTPETEALLTTEDVAFIRCVFGDDILTETDLNTILRDEGMKGTLLESRHLFEALTQESNELEVSEYLFYNVLSRQAALQAGLSDRAFAENVSLSLLEMARLHHADCGRQHCPSEPKYVPVKLSILVREMPGWKKVLVRAQLGQLKLVFDGHLQEDSGNFGVVDPPYFPEEY